MTINPPTKAKRLAETKAANKDQAYIDALEKELARAKSLHKPESRLKEISAELAKFKPAKPEQKKGAA